MKSKPEEEELPPLPPLPQRDSPIGQNHRIVIIGDGEEAALTALMIARDRVVNYYKYKVYLIQGGKGVKPDAKDAENTKAGFSWVPFNSLKFSLNFLFYDGFRSRISERHFFNYLKYRFTHTKPAITGPDQYNLMSDVDIQSVFLQND